MIGFRRLRYNKKGPLRESPASYAPSEHGFFSKIFFSLVDTVTLYGEFLVDIFEYLLHKADGLIWSVQVIVRFIILSAFHMKFQAVGRLIWARGRYATRARSLVLIAFIWLVFLAGGVFQGQLVEQNILVDQQFLSSRSALLTGNVSAATLTAKEHILDTPMEHVVAEGESLDGIAKQYGINIESIKFANNLVYDSVKVGQKLQIPPVEGTLHTVKNGDTVESLARRYRVPSQSIVDFNYLDAPYTLTAGQILTIPNAELPKTERYYASNLQYESSAYGVIPYAKSGPKGSGNFLWPFNGIITQEFHKYHPALDIAAHTGDIHAADKGVVIRAGWWKGGYGNAVQIDHGNGYVTTYAHMSEIAVSEGQSVDKGQKIGVVGSTGRSTGPHVHFSIQREGQYLDPLQFFGK